MNNEDADMTGRRNLVWAIVGEYRSRLKEILGDRLDSVVLYGSTARGDAGNDSDIDVLCIIRGEFDYGTLIELTSEAAGDLSLKYDVVIATAFVRSEEFQTRNTPFLMNVRREGVAV